MLRVGFDLMTSACADDGVFLYGAVVVVCADCCSFLWTQEVMDSTQMTNGGLLAHGVIAPYDVSASSTLSGSRSWLIRMR